MRKGFTLLETVFAIAVFGLVVSMTMGSWLLFMYKSNRVNTQVSLDMDVRKVIERFRSEIRGTARETIIFYPENQEPYQAVGFALAGSGTNGLVEMTADGSNILWRQTVVYHVWNQSPHQMRRTVFSDRYADASYADRYNQIATVVTSGGGGGACLAGESAQTEVMFENLFTGKLWHAEAKFDGYAPAANTRERVTFGSLPLGAGNHTVSFTVSGKNPASTGYALRLDQVAASVGGWPLEAELRTTSGASAVPFYVGQGLAGAAYGLTAATAGSGNTLSVTVENDVIEECVFIGEGRNVTFSNTVVRFDTDFRPAGLSEGSYTAKLDGQFKTAWWGSEQSFNQSSGGRDASPVDLLYKPGTNCVIRIPVRGAFVREDGYGPIFRMYRSAYNYNLQILNPAYAATDTVDSPDIDDSTNLVRLAFYQNGVKKASWAACAAGGVDLRPDRLVPVGTGQNFIFSFQAMVSTPLDDGIRAFRIQNDTEWWCWLIKGGDAATAMQCVWSTDPRLDKVREKEGTGTWKICLPGLVNMAVNYAEGGDYVSHVFDTRSESGTSKTMAWNASVPAGASLTMYARSGDALTEDGFGIADAAAWENVPAAANGSVFSGSTGRFVQFRSVFTAQPASQYPGQGGLGASGPYRSNTPKLQWVRFRWDGEEKYVDVTADLLKSPDCGIFEVKVDGKPLVRGVTMEIEIFKDILTQGGVMKERMRSAMTAEVEPRNNGK